MGLKTALAPWVHRVGLWTGHSARRARGMRVDRILMLHGVGDAHFSAAAFEAVCRYLQSHFELTRLDALVEAGSKVSKRIALTFDDGLANNASVAYPILARLGIPATFFVCPGLIDRGAWMWNHEARARLGHLGMVDRAALAESWGAAGPGGEVEPLIEWMKVRSLTEREACEAQLRDRTGDFEPDAAQRAASDVMSWADLRGLDPELVQVGSHSIDHPLLSTLDPAALDEQVAGSRRMLEERLERTVDCFCYPNGAKNDDVVARVRETYRAAVTTDQGFVTRGRDLHLLPRISIGETVPLLAWRLHRPSA